MVISTCHWEPHPYHPGEMCCIPGLKMEFADQTGHCGARFEHFRHLAEIIIVVNLHFAHVFEE